MKLSRSSVAKTYGKLRPSVANGRFRVCRALRHEGCSQKLPQLRTSADDDEGHSLIPVAASGRQLASFVPQSSSSRPAPAPTAPAAAPAAPASWHRQLTPGGLLAAAAAAALAASLALGALPAEAAAPAADTAALSIPGIVGDSPLREGFVSGFLLIFFSEIGDKTFFIALLLALKQPKGLVFAGTFGALAVMTVISVLLGQVLHQVDELVPGGSNLPYDDLLAVALLLYFGIKTLQDAKDADESAAEEKEEAKEVVDNLAGGNGQDALRLALTTFTLVFAAEWGDKSFLATIALAAASSPAGVTAGAVAGHGVATGLAVAGGGFLSRYFSERVLQYVGGSLFLVFAAATVVDLQPAPRMGVGRSKGLLARPSARMGVPVISASPSLSCL